MKHKVSELEGVLLDQATGLASGWRRVPSELYGEKWVDQEGKLAGVAPASSWNPSSEWRDGGEIVERENITLGAPDLMNSGLWEAFIDTVCRATGRGDQADIHGRFEGYGPTPLIAAMRAFVASKLGEEVDL